MTRIRYSTARRPRQRSLFDVFSLSVLGIFGVGFFVLVGLLASAEASMVTLAVVLAAAAAVPTILSVSELSTAMPRSGGAYFFIDRSLGPAVGLVGGLAAWTAYVVECAFIFVCIGLLAATFVEVPADAVATGILVALGSAQLAGMRRLNRPRRVVAGLVLGALAAFIVASVVGVGGAGAGTTQLAALAPALGTGTEGLIALTGLVFLAFAGFIGAGSIAEHVRDPEYSIPRGMLLAAGTAVVGLGFVTIATVGVWSGSTPAGEAGAAWPLVALAVVAAVAALTAAHDRLSSVTRLTEQMADDGSLPSIFGRTGDGRIAQFSLFVTVAIAVAAILLLDAATMVRIAVAMTLVVFAALNLAVIVMRESHIDYYRPAFESPLYPLPQIVGLGCASWLLFELGWVGKLAAPAVVFAGLAVYFGYARQRTDRSGAMYHVFARLGSRQSVGLDHELREILGEKGLHDGDPYDELIESATTLDLRHSIDFDEALRTGARMLASGGDIDAEQLEEAFFDELRLGLMPIYDGVAVPHHLFTEIEEPRMMIMRMRVGARVSFDERRAHIRNRGQVFAAIFLLCPDSMMGAHLRMLSQLAARAEQPGFLAKWLEAGSARGLKEVLSDGVSADSGESHDDLLAVIDWEEMEAEVDELGDITSEDLVDTLPPSYVDRTDWLRSN